MGLYLISLMLQANIHVHSDCMCRLHLQLLSMCLQIVCLKGHVLSLCLRLCLQQHVCIQ